jgi:hypothetical protein
MSDNDVPTYGYEYGIDPLVEIGKIRAFGKRILARAILRTDAYDVQNGGTLHTVASNSSDAEAFVVISVGGQVEKWCLANGDMPPQVGDHIECGHAVISLAGKRFDVIIAIPPTAGIVDRRIEGQTLLDRQITSRLFGGLLECRGACPVDDRGRVGTCGQYCQCSDGRQPSHST